MRATHWATMEINIHYLKGVRISIESNNPECSGFQFEVKAERLTTNEMLMGRSKTLIDCDDRYEENILAFVQITKLVVKDFFSTIPTKPLRYGSFGCLSEHEILNFLSTLRQELAALPPAI